MTPKQRKILFFVFADVSAGRADNYPYSQGYRLNLSDTNGKLLVKTGGLFIKAEPKQCAIYINGKLTEKPTCFSVRP